jgi:two-component sensor histidine kinase
LKKALQIKNGAKDKEGYISALNKLNKLYLAQNDLASANAIAMVADSLMPQSGFYGLRAEHAFLLSDIFYRKKLYDRSIQYSRHGLLLRDSLFDKDMAAVVSRLNISYKTALRERELFLAKQMQTEQSYRLTRQSYFIGFLVFILVFLTSVAVLLYRAAQFRKKAKLRVDLLMAELSHRVKNNLQLLSGMLNMQLANAADESQQSTIRAINSRIQSIGILHSLLESDVDTGTVNMRGFIESLSANLRLAYSGRANRFNISPEVDEIWLFSKQAIPLGLIVNELVTNIFKYADLSGEPQLKISLQVSSNHCILIVQDNCGFWEKKPSTGKAGGFGLVLVDTLVQQLDARYERTIDEQGTKHVVEFTKID